MEGIHQGMVTHSSILAWRTPWTEEPGGLQSMGSQRVGHDGANNTFTFFHEMIGFLGRSLLLPVWRVGWKEKMGSRHPC